MIGFLLNGIPIAISPGVDIVLGSAFVMTGLRLISRAQFAVAFSIASSKTIWLWGHQWAWLIWTLEGAFLAWRRNQRSPVYVDLSFWLFIGSVLVWLTYAYVLAVDRETVHLTVLKQAINGVLNVALGEILYIALSYVLRASANVTLPSVSVGSIIFPSMIVLPVLPALLLMRIQAPTWEQLVARSAEMQLSEDLDRVKHRLIEWRDRETVLLMKSADKDINKGLGIIGSVRTDLENEGAVTRRAMSLAYPVGHPLLLATGVSNRRFVLAAPNVDGGAIFASISQANLDAALKGTKSDADGSFIILVDAQNRIAASSSSILPDPQIVQSLLSAPVGRLTKIVPAPAFGISQMNNAKRAMYLLSTPLPALGSWRLISAVPIETEVIDRRLGQTRFLVALACLILLLALLASAASRAFLLRLNQVTKSVSELAWGGADAGLVHSVMISELADVFTTVRRKGDRMTKEREQLLVQRQRLDSIASFAPVIIFSFERNGEPKPPITYMSPNAERLLGYSVREMLQPGWWFENLHPDDRRLWSDLLQPGTVTANEYRLRHKQGHFVWVYECIVVNRNAPDEAVGIMIDISDRKKIADQLGFSSKMESLGRIAAGIAHELNQPLQVIRLSLQNIERRLRKENFASTIIFDKLGIVSGQIDRAAKIISQVNTFGKPRETAKRAFKINDVIKDTVTLLRMQIDDSEATISTHPSDQELWVNVDPLRLEQIIINLVQNARQAIARRKRTSPDAGEITIRSERGQGGVILTVQDNGTGIKHAELELLFEPFFTTKTNEGGTGLGLSVSYGIIQEMGGRIWAENVENGARFSIWLEEGPAL